MRAGMGMVAGVEEDLEVTPELHRKPAMEKSRTVQTTSGAGSELDIGEIIEMLSRGVGFAGVRMDA